LIANIDSAKFSGRVLVVEDNPVNCLVIDAMLAGMGMTPTIVHDGQQALDALMLDNFLPDLVLMDLHMPVMDGYSATQQIRQWEVSQHRAGLPIVALTADAFEEDHQHCLSVGMNDFLTKPISVDALHRVLARWVCQTAQSQPPTAIASSPAAVAFDQQKFMGLVDELTPLLERNGFDALAKMDELQRFVACTCLEAGIHEVDELLQSFRFDLALARLRQVVAQQGDCGTA
jgi:CheY-like chemotaxis protein